MRATRGLLLVLTLVLPVTVLVSNASLADSKLEATIFSYDGHDFVRTANTLMDGGKSAVSTKFDPNSPAYKALVQKHSYVGPSSVFGREYQSDYAPLINDDG